ncbi:MAG: rRNA maturation RNase YbeY [Mycoplasma sp.]|nr:rRNA maturation RNase YbeY [Mycoplasma sp.]
MIKLYVNNKTKYNFKFKRLFKKIIKLISKEFGVKKNIEISLIIINNKDIKKYNRDYRNKDYSTDILTFPQNGLELGNKIGKYLMGDIFISFEKIISQSEEFGHNLKREWSYIFAHGVLHLFGLNHIKKEEELYMNNLAEKIMKKIKVGR